MRAVHQLVPSFVFGDATGQAALHLQLLLRRLGIPGDIYAQQVEGALSSVAKPLRALAPGPDDLVLYHHGLASSLAGRLMHLPCRRGIVFHNISPASAYVGTPLHHALVSGRAQLAAMAPFVDVAIGVSEYNAAELREAGYRNVHVVPLFIEPERFAASQADARKLSEWRGSGPTLVALSRIAAHKRFDDVLSLYDELTRIRPDARLLCVGGFEAGSTLFRRLRKRADTLPDARFVGRVNHGELVAAYRAADLFVSMSEHEGFGVPLLEAMAADVPVLAFGAAAVPETLGGAGVAFDEKHFAGLAEVASELCAPGPLRERILAGQRQRLEAFSADAVMPSLGAALDTVSQIERPESAPARRRAARRRVGIVVQRWGEGIGGAERHARMVAERLVADGNDVTVFTTTAEDHLTWANVFPEGDSQERGLTVRRFAVERPRRMREFNRLSRGVFEKPQDRMHEEHWVAEQGPLCPGLLHALASERDDFDAFLFFTYLYAPTVHGVPLVADKALVVPTAHEEPPIRFRVFADVFERPRALLVNTPEELDIIHRHYPKAVRARVTGVGIDDAPGDAKAFRRRHGLRDDERYLFYLGRLEEGKGVGQLVRDYAALRSRLGAEAPTLVLGGKGALAPKGPGIRLLGPIPEEDKLGAMAGAFAVVCPSQYESLSLLTLDAFAQGTPVLVNGKSEVLRGQVSRSGAGVTYVDTKGFIDGFAALERSRERWVRLARKYARDFTWPRVMDIYREEIDALAGRKR